MEVSAAVGQALGAERAQTHWPPSQAAREQATREQAAREQAAQEQAERERAARVKTNPERAGGTQAAPGQERTMGRQRMRGWQAGQQRTVADDSKALERRRPAEAPPLIGDPTPTGRPGYRPGGPPAEPYDELRRA